MESVKTMGQVTGQQAMITAVDVTVSTANGALWKTGM